MKTGNRIRKQILNTSEDKKIIVLRLIVGLIFLSEGLQKYMVTPMLGPAFFKDVGFDYPLFWTYFTGAFEICCGILVLFGFLTRLASIPLLTIMFAALITTKLPLLANKDFWDFAHEYNVDFSLTLLLLVLIVSGGGKWSVDLRLQRSENH